MTDVAPLLGVGPTALVRARAVGRAQLRRTGVDPLHLLTRSRAARPLVPEVSF